MRRAFRARRMPGVPHGIEDLHWSQAPWTVIDLETTGLDLRRDEIVSIGAVDIDAGAVDAANAFYALTQTTRTSSKDAIEVHGITPHDMREARPASEVATEMSLRLEGRLLIAHASWIESAFLRRLAREHRVSLSDPCADTAALTRAARMPMPERGCEPSLELLATRLDLPVYSPHHALGDAFTTAVVFLALATRIEREHRDTLTVGDLCRLSLSHSL